MSTQTDSNDAAVTTLPGENGHKQSTPATSSPTSSSSSSSTPGSTPNQDPTGQTPKDAESQADIDALPEWARAEIKALRGENADRRRKQKQADDQAKTAQEQAMVEQQQWQQLAETRGQELAALKPKADQLEELVVLFQKQFDDEIKDWPPELRAMAPDEQMPVTAKLVWLEKARKTKKLLQASKSVVPGNHRGPDPAAAGNNRTQDSGPLIDARERF